MDTKIVTTEPSTMQMPEEFRMDGSFGVWVWVGVVFAVTLVAVAVLAFGFFLDGVVYEGAGRGIISR